MRNTTVLPKAASLNAAHLCAAAFCLAGAALSAQQSQSSPPREVPQFRSGVSVLRVDTSVVDGSARAIADLSPADFHVTIDGRPRTVVFAQFTGASGVRDGQPGSDSIPSYSLNARGGRAVVLLIDLDSIRVGNERPLLETAAQLVERLRPIDAVAVVPLPGQSIDLTRDHATVGRIIRSLHGTSQVPFYRYSFSLEEALGFERRDKRVISDVIERECSRDVEVARAQAGTALPPVCPPQLERDTRDRLAQERLHIQMVLSAILNVADQLRTVQAPASIVLISGGLGFEQESLARYQQVERALKESGGAIATVQVSQPEVDASTSRSAEAVFYSNQDRQSGLANVATMSGGMFYQGIGRATGVFERLLADLTETYELGIEAEPGDLDGKPHDLRVTTTRQGTVHARRYVRAPATAGDSAARLATLIAQPIDVGELPIAVAAHSVRGDEATTLKSLIRADIGHGITTTPPIRYAARVMGADAAVVMNVTGTAAADGGLLLSTQLAPGRYRLRLAAIDGDGRRGVLDVPIAVGLRPTGVLQAGDLIVGTVSGGALTPSIYAPGNEPVIPTLELTTAESARFAQTAVAFEVRRRGENDVLSKADAKLEETAYDRQRIARASLPTRDLPPGDYTLSAVISIDGQPAGRVSRAFIVEAGARPAAASVVPSPEATPMPANPPTSTRITDPILEPVMHKTAVYVAGYGEQMSAVIGVEKYTQQVNPSGSERPMPPRQIVAEFALVKSGGPIPWSGFRDVVEVNGTPVRDRKDRILRILADSANPIEEAARLTAESARFNIGPVSRNFNLPTTALFFFHESNLGQFTFTRKGTKKIDGVDTLEIAFRETARPTLITTRAGKDVPCEGTLWVIPETGAIVRTRLQLKGFADALAIADSKDASGRTPPPPTPPPVVTSAPSGSQGAGSTGARPTGWTAGDANAGALRSRFGDFGNAGGGITQLESTAEIEVTYRRHDVLGMWLPARMSEEYQGAIPRISNVPLQGTSHSTATYSDYKRFGTSATIVGPKKDQ